MRTIKILSIAILLIAMTFTACTKEEGIGGKGQIKGQTYSYLTGKVLKGTTIYVKYGTTIFPGPDISKYDALGATDTEGKFEIKELTKGDYYIYATGVDNGQNVSGGVHILLINAEIKENVNIFLVP